MMAAIDTLVAATALSEIRLDLGASVEQLEWTVNAFAAAGSYASPAAAGAPAGAVPALATST
jgi:hypothetical protein